MARNSQRIEFTGGSGELLAARLDEPAGTPRAYALFAHCFSCSKDVFAANRISRRLADQSIAVLRFDFTGLGASEGDFANTNFSSNVDDLVAAAAWLSENRGGPDLVVGHSLGGAAAIVAANRMPSAKAVVTLAAPADAVHVKDNFIEHVPEIEARGQAQVRLAGRPFTIKRQFLEDIAAAKVEEAAATLRRPLLVAHAPLDAQVGIENATRLFVAAKHPKSFLSLDSADHLLSRHEDAVYAADVIAAWAGRYVFGGDEAGPSDPPTAFEGPNAVAVRETGAGRFQNHVVAGPHVMLADEPGSVGGDESGPNPYEYLNAALGACTSMTIRMYADRKGWPLERVSVRLTQEKGHADDCVRCDEDTKAKADIITREVVLEGALDDAQIDKLMEIADKCPVHRTLHGPLVVRTRRVAQ